MHKYVFVAAIIGLMMVIVGSVNAASISYPTSTPVAYSTTDWTNNLLFQKFNPSLGKLYKAELYISASINTTLTVINSAASSSSGNAKTHVIVTVTDPLSLLGVAPEMYTTPFYYNLPAGGQVVSGLLTKSGSGLGSWTSSAILSEFTGTGIISMSAGTFTETVTANTGGNTAASQVTTASATGTVTYYYDAPQVPEPASLLAFFVGIIGLFGYSRRRRS